MKTGIESLLAAALIALGYGVVVAYLGQKRRSELSWKALKPGTRSRILYLVIATGINAATVFCFRRFYPEYGLLHQCKLIVLINLLIASAAVDYRLYKIPNPFLLVGLGLRAVFYIIEFAQSVSAAWEGMKGDLLAAGILMAFFLLIAAIFKGSVGMGDIKLMGIMGLYQGVWGSANAVFYSMLMAFFLSIALMILKKKTRNDTIAFGPCIMLGTAVSIMLTGI